MAAAFVPYEIVTVGVTPQTAVPIQGVGKWAEVLSLLAINRDTVRHTIIAKKVGGTVTPEEIGRAVLEGIVNGVPQKAQLIIGAVAIDGSSRYITVESDATATTTEPVIDVAIFSGP